jgi:iturin family lipopeptide synthetase A
METQQQLATPASDAPEACGIEDLVALLRWRARIQGADFAIGFIDEDEALADSITFAGLDARARAIGAWLARNGARSEYVLLSFPTSVDYLCAFFGCLYAGAIPVPVFPPHSKDFKALRLGNILKDCSARWVLTSAAPLEDVKSWLNAAGSDAVAVDTGEIAPEEADAWVHPQIEPGHIAFLQYTSGSTNAPKGVMVTHANLLHNMRVMRQRWCLHRGSTIVSWLPIFHDLGMVGNNLFGVYLGARQYLMIARMFVKRPGAWLRAISRYRGEVAMAPNFAYRLCTTRVTEAEKRELDLSCLRLAANGGEPVIAAMTDAFLEAFAACGLRPECMSPSMGMAETTLMLSSKAPEVLARPRRFDLRKLRSLLAVETQDANALARHVMSCGPALEEFELRIVDPVTLRALGEGELGELWVSSRSVAAGYWNKPEATAALFQAHIADTGEGPFLRTGDQGFFYEGELYICGRLKNMIIVRGQNFAPTDIEIAVEEGDPVLRPDFGVAFAVGEEGEERLVLVYEIETDLAELPPVERIFEKAVTIVSEAFELQLYGLSLVSRGTLSKTTSGKVTREKTRSQFLDRQLSLEAQWLHPAVRKVLRVHQDQDAALRSVSAAAESATSEGPASAPAAGHAGMPDEAEPPSIPPSRLRQWLCDTVAELLEIDAGDIEADKPFAAYGFGSLAAAELAARLEEALKRPISESIAYDYPSIARMTAYLLGETASVAAAPAAPPVQDGPVAVIGMACRLPGAPDVHAFWENLAAGVDAVTDAGPGRWGEVTGLADDETPIHARWGGFLDGVDQFDPDFFGITAQEAAVMDPQQRLLLEVAWEALESAGIRLDVLSGSDTGVFVGISGNDYTRLDLAADAGRSPYDGTGNAMSIAANRMSYLWDLRGPSMAIDTACSSSLVALHAACRSLQGAECDQAIVAGVNLLLAPDLNITFSQAGMMSPHGRCRSFDDAADGYVRSEGCVAMILKPLAQAFADGDAVHAVIRGTAVNQDGRSNGLTAPNGPAQERVVAHALRRAGLRPDDIDYIEAHGSGTPLGDPIEVGALANVFAGRSHPLPIGSVKSNVGHLEAAAGLAGVLKALLALRHERLPASLHVAVPNRRIPWDRIPVEICAQVRPWPRGERPRRAGVAAFGFGGTNAHAIVEEAPFRPDPGIARVPADAELLVLSARTPAALDALLQRHDQALAALDPQALGGLCAAAALGRTAFRCRFAAVAASPERLREAIAGHTRAGDVVARGTAGDAPHTVWLFSGQGGARPGMAASLYEAFPMFRDRLDQCARWFAEQGRGALLPVLIEDGHDGLSRASLAQPALFAFQWALGGLWLDAGIRPAVVCGHSIGEYAAACIAGLLEPEQALHVIAERGRLMEGLPEAGAMLAVAAAPEALADLLAVHPQVSISAYNGPAQVVCAGPRAALRVFAEAVGGCGLRCTELKVTHAFHSALMRPMSAPFAAVAAQLDAHPARLPFVSSVDGRLIATGERLPADYWVRHVEAPVDFAAAWRAASAHPITHALEIGAGPQLTTLAQAMAEGVRIEWLQPPGETRSLRTALLGAAARLFASGASMDLSAFHRRAAEHALQLPTYPFQRRRCWNRRTGTVMVANQSTATVTGTASKLDAPHVRAVQADDRRVRERVSRMISDLLGVSSDAIDPQIAFLEMGLDSIALIGVVRQVEREFGLRIEIREIFEALQNVERLSDHIAGNAAAAVAVPPPEAVDRASVAAIGETCAVAGTGVPAQPLGRIPAAAQIAPAAPAAPPQWLPHTPSTYPVGDGWQAVLSQQLDAMTRLMQSQLALLGQASPVPLAGSALPPPITSAPAAGVASASPRMRAAAPRAAGTPSIPMWKVAETSAAPLTPQQQAHLDALVARYCARTRASKDYAARHRTHLADNRVAAGFRMLTKEMHYPLVSRAAKGARMWDIDGNEYIDVTMGFGVNLLGHNPPFVTDAIAARLAQGMQLGPQAELAGEVAELICELTGNERAAFVNSGTEAVMIACRLARAATGRDLIVIFNGAYHGQHESTIVVVDADDPECRALPGVPGVTAHSVANTVMLNYADDAALAWIARNADRIAGVMVEPVQSRQPELRPREFLHALRALTERHGIALIFDEMLIGFRCHLGGAQALFDVRADLVTYGKIVGGGLPIGVISGRRAFMDVIDGGAWTYGDASYPMVETTFVSGTHSKHPLTMAAAHAVLTHLKAQGPKLQDRLNARTAAFAERLNGWLAQERVPVRVPAFSSIFRIAFAGNGNLLYYHMLEKGVFLWEGRVYALSTAHSDDDLERIVAAMQDSVDALRDGGFLPPGEGARTERVPRAAPHASAARSEPATASDVSATAARASAPGARRVDFSMSFFGAYAREYRADKYDLMFAGARFADRQGFSAVWVPERHFHPFGGHSPNPSVAAAALARETRRIQLRAGSVVVPLHHPIRIAEEWALVDNLAQGRVGIAAASGWHPEDFVLAPDAYRDNREITFRNLETVRKLWRGEAVQFTGGTGTSFGARIYPMPCQAELPIWITVVKNPETYAEAGRRGYGVLTNMMGQSLEELRTNIAVYRAAREEAGLDPAGGRVAVLVHAYVTDDEEAAQRTAAKPFRDYLGTMSGLLDSLAKSFGREENFNSLSADDRDYLLDATYQRYVRSAALIGSPESCAPIVESLADCGVNELACFVDFGIDEDLVLRQLPNLDRLRARFAAADAGAPHVAVGIGSQAPTEARVLEEEL